VFLVSHDRRFLDNVVTSTIVSEGEGRWREYEGGVEDWLAQSARASALRASAAPAPAPAPARAEPVRRERAAKLSFKEQRELEELPDRIDELETEQKELGEALSSGELYKQEPQRVAQVQARYAAIEEELLVLLERWEALSSR